MRAKLSLVVLVTLLSAAVSLWSQSPSPQTPAVPLAAAPFVRWAPEDSALHYQRRSGDLFLELRAKELRLRQNQRTLYSFREEQRRIYEEEWRAAAVESYSEMAPEWIARGDAAPPCASTSQRRPLSWVGPLLSVLESEYAFCFAAHPMSIVEVKVHDARRPGEEAALDQIFPPDEIFRALRSDRVVQRHLRQSTGQAPRDLTELLQRLADQVNECEYSFRYQPLKSFAFYELRGAKVAVRLFLPHGCEAARGNSTQLGIWLDTPAPLRSTFQAAASGRAGFLMKAAPAQEACIGYFYPPDAEENEGCGGQ